MSRKALAITVVAFATLFGAGHHARADSRFCRLQNFPYPDQSRPDQDHDQNEGALDAPQELKHGHERGRDQRGGDERRAHDAAGGLRPELLRPRLSDYTPPPPASTGLFQGTA
jgi:hypothetical protein